MEGGRQPEAAGAEGRDGEAGGGGPGEPRALAGRRGRRLPALPTVVVLAILGSLGALLFLRSRPEQQVLRLVDAQVKLAKAAQAAASPGAGVRLRPPYATLGPRAKQSCDRDGLFGALLGLPPGFWELVEYRDVRVRVQGDRAFVTYVITYNETPVEEATPEDPDLYVRPPETALGPVQSVEERLATPASALTWPSAWTSTPSGRCSPPSSDPCGSTPRRCARARDRSSTP